MDFTLTRFLYKKEGIFGRLEDAEKTLSLYTLEHAFLIPGDEYSPIIPEGTYKCTRYKSPKAHGEEVWLLHDVPGHSYVEIHIGNYNKDSDGCILVGLRFEGVMISSSRVAFGALMKIQEGRESFNLTVVDSPNRDASMVG